MADKNTAPEEKAPEVSEVSTPTAAESPAAQSIAGPSITVQKGALVGDENLPAPAATSDRVTVISEDEPAQVSPAAPEGTPTTSRVHETHVQTDTVILDPSSPEAVQIPDAGIGSLDLPIHALSNPSPEEVFASKA